MGAHPSFQNCWAFARFPHRNGVATGGSPSREPLADSAVKRAILQIPAVANWIWQFPEGQGICSRSRRSSALPVSLPDPWHPLHRETESTTAEVRVLARQWPERSDK